MNEYLDDFVCEVTCEEYWDNWSDWENWDAYEEDYIDTPSAPSYGIPDACATYAASTYEFDWSDWDI